MTSTRIIILSISHPLIVLLHRADAEVWKGSRTVDTISCFEIFVQSAEVRLEGFFNFWDSVFTLAFLSNEGGVPLSIAVISKLDAAG